MIRIADEIETRLNEIRMLKRKYGNTVEEILAYADKIEQEILRLKIKTFILKRRRNS